MEFLKKLFNEELNAEGEILITTESFDRDEVFRQMAEPMYKIAFNEWKKNRIVSLLDKADDILSNHNNKRRFDTLKSIYNQGNVVPFIGAGMSILSGYASWTSFLYTLREETRITEEELNSLISTGEYEEAAQKLLEGMATNSFNEEIENEYANCKDISGCIQYLPYIFNEKVITTNFECVLEKCYDNAEKEFKKVISGAESIDIARIMTRENSLLIKLHGEADRVSNRILTKDEYDTFYTESNTLKNCIELISANSLLFLGCSLSTDRTIKTMIEIADEKGHDNIARHYAFLSLKETDDKIEIKAKLAKANIFPIFFDSEDDRDECIEALLLKLADGIVEL